MKLYPAVALAVMLSFAPVTAQGFKSMTLASNLGTVLASEEMCGLSYDQEAIAAFIEENVDPKDMGFASNLQMMTEGQAYNLRDMSASARTAHCTQIRRVAKSYGFIKE